MDSNALSQFSPPANAPEEIGAPGAASFEEAPFLVFRLGASLFGVSALAVRTIHALPALSPLQETAPFIVGVLNLRGQIVPVMDLNARFDQNSPPYRLEDSVVVLSWGGAEVALLVNEVRAVCRIAPSQVEAAPAHGRRRDLASPFVAGLAHIGEEIVMLLHLPHLLSLPAPGDSEEHDSLPDFLAPRFDLGVFAPAESEILEKRAARLLMAGENTENVEEGAPVAVVALGGEEFGVELDVVREFVSVGAVAAVPCCPPHVLGQFNLRGDIVTLVDVRQTLRTAKTTPAFFEHASQTLHSVVVVNHEDGPVGIAVDGVRDVLYLGENERLALDAKAQSGAGGKFFMGGALYEGRLLPLLDVEKLFTEGGLAVEEGT